MDMGVPSPAQTAMPVQTMAAGNTILIVTSRRRIVFPHVLWLGFVLLAALAVALVPNPAIGAARWAGLATTVFHNYGRDQGLPHPVPTALAQDREGFIWIGTQGGLARWDGYRFRKYVADHDVPGSLPDDWVQTVHVDSAGRLWVGGGGGGLARYDPARDRFVPVPLGPSTGRTHIGAIADDGAGGLWIGKQDGLHHLNPATGAVTALRTGMAGATHLPRGVVQAILRDRSGALWIGTVKGLARRAPRAGDFVAVPFDGATSGVSALFEDADSRIWIGTQQQGLFVIDRPGATPRRIGGGAGLLTGAVSSICAVGPHEIWTGLRGGGILAIDTATGQVRSIRHDPTLANSLAHNDVWALLRDSAGSIWAGGSGGLSYHPRDTGRILTIFGAPEAPGGLSGADVLSSLATRGGAVWLGYLDGGADRIDPATSRVTAFRPKAANESGALPPDALTSFAEGDDGTVYFGTRRGLYAKSPAAAAPHLVFLPERDPHASVSTLRFDDGLLWVGGEEDGLWGGKPGTGRPIFGPDRSARLADRGMNIIRRGTGRNLWVGTRNGLERIDLTTLAIEHIMANPADPGALPGRNVVALLTDGKGRLWVGTFGGGLALMTGRSADGRPRFRRFGLAQGLPHLNVDSLQMDGSGTIWAGTDDGLARIDPDRLTIRAVRRADGSFLSDYMAGAGATSATGEALLGSLGGLTVVRPGPLPGWRFQPPIVVTDLRIGGVSVPVDRINGAPRPDPLIVTPEANSLAVEFAALDFTAPERNRYAYRLDGYDRDWTETDASRRLAIYTNLPPGNYTLHLRGSNRAGLWTGRELVLPVTVQPAWYQRLWFKLATALLAIVAITQLVRWRTALLRRRQGELERQIAERTADLRAANERLGQLATTDPLTDCANRWFFIEQARELITLGGQYGGPISLVVLDLDQFKQVNDSYGHPVGDAVLAKAGQLLHKHARDADLVGRMGGEEFALLLPHMAAAPALDLAERLRQAIGDNSVELYGVVIQVTASLGVAEMRPGEDFDTLYARADTALYAAKNAGRNRVEAAV